MTLPAIILIALIVVVFFVAMLYFVNDGTLPCWDDCVWAALFVAVILGVIAFGIFWLGVWSAHCQPIVWGSP